MKISRQIAIHCCIFLFGIINCPVSIAQLLKSIAPSKTRMNMARTMYPDMATRREVQAIRIVEVSKMSFYGIDIGHMENNPIDIKDRKIILRFLVALKHARAPYLGTPDRANTLLIYTKSMKKGKYPLRFDFNPKHQESCFGPEFFRVVNKFVPMHSMT